MVCIQFGCWKAGVYIFIVIPFFVDANIMYQLLTSYKDHKLWWWVVVVVVGGGWSTVNLVFYFGPNLFPLNLRFGIGPSRTIRKGGNNKGRLELTN